MLVKLLSVCFQFKVQSETKPGEFVNFRAVLLTRCQREFEKDKSSEVTFIAKREEIEKTEDVSSGVNYPLVGEGGRWGSLCSGLSFWLSFPNI